LTQVVSFLQYVTAGAFVVLAVAISYRWFRQRGRAEQWLALSLIALAVVSVIGRLQATTHPIAWLQVLSIVGFLASGFFVLLFRNEFIPLSRTAMRAAIGLLAVSVAVGIINVVALADADPLVVTIALLELIGAWTIFTGEPIVRFWLASNKLPAVQRWRMRFLSLGFLVLIVVLFIAVLDRAAFQSPASQIAVQLAVLAVVPAIYVSFSPPSLLRRLWRISEEPEVRSALQDLLIFSPSREVLAERAAYWAARLMGGMAGFVIGSDGKVLAKSGMDDAAAEALAARLRTEPASTHSLIVAPLYLAEGNGILGVVGGPFAPMFGTDEVAQLKGYANAVVAGLERAKVTERMAAIERGKTQFLNLASHELRGPVTVIRGYVSMLESGLLGQLNERGRMAAGVMAAKVSEMNDLIEGMIEAARLEDGALTLRLVECDLREIARAAAEVVAPLVDASHSLNLDLPERRVRVNIDQDRTRTIVTNLLSNALKYSPDGGDVTCQIRARAGMARLSVSDEGLGIAAESLPTLFTRFGRVITPETEHLKGTGLGLFLGRQLARMQGGDITVFSTPGQGSTFTLHLPVLVPANGSPDSSSPERASAPLERSAAKTD
jgi:signal transduction histidine kinase